MKSVLNSVCFGNWKGYEGTKEEIPEMFKKCKEECKNNKSSLESILYNEKHIEKMKSEENGLYKVEYWSKW